MIKFYQGKKYAHLNTKLMINDHVSNKVITVKGNHVLMLSTDRNNFKRITNSTDDNSGTIVMYDLNDSQGNDTPIHLRSRRWCCDSWAIPNKAMQAYLDDNHAELLALLGR